MLPMFIDRGAVNTFWFLDFERKGWVSNEPATEKAIYHDDVICERSELSSQQDKPLTMDNWREIARIATVETTTQLEPHSPTVTTTDFESVDDSSILSVATKPELLPISDYVLSREELEELSTYHTEIELLPAKPSWRRI